MPQSADNLQDGQNHVIGIVNAFKACGPAEGNLDGIYCGGISEALVSTAMGLLAAVQSPAVLQLFIYARGKGRESTDDLGAPRDDFAF